MTLGLLAGCRAEPAGSASLGPVAAGPKTPKNQAQVGVSSEQDASSSEDSAATATTTATSSTTAGGSTTATAGRGSASESVEPTAAGAGEKSCGWLPTGTRNFDTYYRPGGVGCGLAPEGPDAWQTITEVEVVGLELRKKGSKAYVVFLDAKGQRVLPVGKTVSYEMRFRRKKSGKIRITAAQQREGVFEFKLPGNSHSKPCTMHLFMRFNNGTEVIEDWLDDWVYKC